MPYIEKKEKEYLEPEISSLLEKLNSLTNQNSGTLNYLFTRIAHNYIKNKGLRYQYLADVSSALQNADKEFYRRISIPYEDKKIKDNGDVLDI